MRVTRCYEIKLQPNKYQQKQLSQYFYEAKLVYNYLLNCSNIFAVHACKIKHVWKFDKDQNKVYITLESLPSKLKQNVHRKIMDSIKSLSASKMSGNQVGRLKFKSEINTIEIDNQSFQIVDSHHIKLSGFGRKQIRCNGLHQLRDAIKVRNAKLMRKSTVYYLKICIDKEVNPHVATGNNLGIDFGIESTLTFSSGKKFNCKIEETVRLKKLQRKISRSYRLNPNRTNNRTKLIHKLREEYQHISNKKNDFVNKLLHHIDIKFDKVIFQDEQIQGWKNLKSCRKTVQHSCLGLVKQKLKLRVEEEPNRYIMLDKWKATTQLCPKCGKKNLHTLDQRIYSCPCGYTEDRDIHAARNMLVFAQVL